MPLEQSAELASLGSASWMLPTIRQQILPGMSRVTCFLQRLLWPQCREFSTLLRLGSSAGDTMDGGIPMPAAPDASQIVLDALGKLHERGYGLFGACLDCSRLYRMDAPAKQRISAHFDIDLGKLIEERGADATCICMPPVPCPRCGSDRTEYRITTGHGGYGAAWRR
jgi:hypothetical protein